EARLEGVAARAGAPRAAVGLGRTPSALVEGVAAGAGALRVRVVDGEALGVDAVGEVDARAHEVGNAHAVDHDREAVVGLDHVAFAVVGVEVEAVAQAGASAGADLDAQAQAFFAFLLDQGFDFVGGRVRELHAGGGGLLDVLGLLSSAHL